MNPYKIFIDTEFNQNVDPVELISIGVVDLRGDREFYATLSDFDKDKCDDWLKKNVLSIYESRDDLLSPKTTYHKGITKAELKKELAFFLGQDKFDAWGYYADYDWYLFTRLWGSFEKLPESFPKLCYDVQQYAYFRLCPNITRHVPEFKPEHHALVDARWTKAAYEFVRSVQKASS